MNIFSTDLKKVALVAMTVLSSVGAVAFAPTRELNFQSGTTKEQGAPKMEVPDTAARDTAALQEVTVTAANSSPTTAPS